MSKKHTSLLAEMLIDILFNEGYNCYVYVHDFERKNNKIKELYKMRGRRKTVKISEAEWSIMKVLWDGCEDNERGMTLGEIVQKLAEPTGWSNTTIRTLIIRLAEKGAVNIDKTTGVYKYTPKSSKTECIKCEVDSFIERVFDNSAYNLMASLVRDCKLTEKQKKEIKDILDGIKD